MKLHILTIIPSLFGGGAEKIVADLSIMLSKNYNHKIVLYNIKEDKYEYLGDLTELDIPKKTSILGRIIRQISILNKILQIKKSTIPNITISHMLVANMLNILSKKNDKTICVLHGEWSVKTGKSKFLDKLVKKQYIKSDMIVSVSHYIKNMFENYYNLNLPHEVVYIGIDNEKVLKKANENLHIELPEKYIIYVAGFRPVKNHIQLIKQLKNYLKETNMHLILVGNGELKDEIKKTIIELNLTKNVILLGNLSNPYPIIKNAVLSLLVSSSESFSLVIVESMALGVPVIATDCGGPREIIDPNWNNWTQTPYQTEFGILIEHPKNWISTTLVKQIDQLLNDDSLFNKISKKGRERAFEFDISNTNKNFDTVIKNLAN